MSCLKRKLFNDHSLLFCAGGSRLPLVAVEDATIAIPYLCWTSTCYRCNKGFSGDCSDVLHHSPVEPLGSLYHLLSGSLVNTATETTQLCNIYLCFVGIDIFTDVCDSLLLALKGLYQSPYQKFMLYLTFVD